MSDEIERIKQEAGIGDRRELISGKPIPADDSHKELKPNGQQRDYVVLSPDERAKGFVRPVRRAYVHLGAPRPKELRDLTPEQIERLGVALNGESKYVKFSPNEDPDSRTGGRYWTQAQLDRIEAGCCSVTTMSAPLAETCARDPHFYSGTFCCGCGAHFPVGANGEFVWDGTDERVGT